MEENRLLLMCSHYCMQIPLTDENDDLDDEYFQRNVMANSICGKCDKILVCMDEKADVEVEWIDGNLWTKQSLELMTTLYKKQYLKYKCLSSEFWEQVEAGLRKHGYNMSVEQCRAKINTMLLQHSIFKEQLEGFDPNPENWFSFKLIDDLLNTIGLDTVSAEIVTEKKEALKIIDAEKTHNVPVVFSAAQVLEDILEKLKSRRDGGAAAEILIRRKTVNLMKEQKRLKEEISSLLDRGDRINLEILVVKHKQHRNV